MSEVGRRTFVAATAAAWLAACSRGAAQLPSDVLHQYRLEVDGPFGEREPVIVSFPRQPGRVQHHPEGRWPVVVALHGLGEAQKGTARGALGWHQDYALARAYEAMLWGSLASDNFGGFVRREQLAALNRALRARRFRGVAVVAPYTPAIAAPDREADRLRYSAWLAGPLLAQVRAAYPGLARTAAGTGIDGVSLGGRLALEAGLRHPESFSAVSGLQPAVRGDAERLAALVDRTAAQRIRLATSDGDPFLEPTRALSAALSEGRVPHELVVYPGPHDVRWNRGPGAIELLRFAAAALRVEPLEP